MADEKFYIVLVVGCVEPELIGSFASAELRDETAKLIHANNDPEGQIDFDPFEDGIFALDVTDGIPHIWAYSGGFFMDDEDEGDE
jgi:hypothetical protein